MDLPTELMNNVYDQFSTTYKGFDFGENNSIKSVENDMKEAEKKEGKIKKSWLKV